MQAMQRCSKGKQVMKDCLLEQEHVTDNQDLPTLALRVRDLALPKKSTTRVDD